MKIIAQKSSFYTNKEFFEEVIKEEYVDGVYLDVLFNMEDELLVYDYDNPGPYVLKKLQNIPLTNLKQNAIISLDEALENIEKNNKDLMIYLNFFPITLNTTDDETLKKLQEVNTKYIEVLKKTLEKFKLLNISLHSTCRNLTSLLEKNNPNNDIGFIVYNTDLTPVDVNYYVFPTYMIDDEIFEKLIDREKQINIYAKDDSDLAIITEKYNSKKSTALSQKILPHLNFIASQPVLISKIF